MSTPTPRSCGCCGSRSASPAPNTAAASRNAAPAPCISTAGAMRSCSLPVSAADGKQITTIEGLAQGGVLHKVQKAWIEHDVPQCGYCQSGMIMAVAALLKDKPKPTDADIDAAITNICRCGTFQQVRAAIHAAAERVKGGSHELHAENESPQLHRGRRRRRRRARARPRPSVRRPQRDPRAGRLARGQRLGRDPARTTPSSSASRAPRWARARSPASPSWSPRSSNATGRRSRPNIRRPARTSPASACGATYSTGGSRGIRTSHEYVRKGGAAAREMLIQAAANEWKVPVVRSARAANGVITHKASGRTTTYGKVAEAAAKLEPPKEVEAQGSEGLEDRRQAAQAARHRSTR